MPKFLLLLMAFLFPMVDEPEDGETTDDAVEDEVEEGEPEESSETTEASADETEEEEEPQPQRTMSRAQREIVKLRERTQQAETAAREAREAVQALQRTQPAPVNVREQEEDAKLKDPNTTDLERWQINANRTLRQSQDQAQRALFQAQEMADRSTYAQKAVSNPIYSKYEKKVEDKIAEIRRSNNSAPPREVVLWTLLGKDMAEGTFKAKTSAKTTTAIPRGKPNGARSDTPSRGGGSTDHQKRTARLLNTQI